MGYRQVIEYQGKKLTLREWSEELGIPHTTLCNRVANGWPTEKILGTPPVHKVDMSDPVGLVMRSYLRAEGRSFDTSEFATVARIPQANASHVMRRMEREGLIKIVTDRQGRIFGSFDQHRILRKPWRKTVPPMIYGGPEWGLYGR